jgi:hypothetical protein
MMTDGIGFETSASSVIGSNPAVMVRGGDTSLVGTSKACESKAA